MTATTTEVRRDHAAAPRTGAPTPARRRTVRRAVLVVAALGLLALPAWARSARAEADRAAARAGRDATEARAEREAADARVAVALGDLDSARGAARVAAADVAAQRGRLVDLAIVEADLEQVVADARTSAEEAESTRDETYGKVSDQAVELPQLETCLVEVRRSLDLAFHATNDPRIVVPPLSATCRVLSSAGTGG